eukprot:12214911-Karenia_brevis.AAC.1
MGSKGDHGRCVANYCSAIPKADEAGQEVPDTRAAKRAWQTPSEELLNHFSWLYMALALPVSEQKFGNIMYLAQHTQSQILDNQYLGKHFFNEGLDSLNR